jgi:RHS repeat-associated protein
MKEIKSLRKSNEKHFLNKDGTITAYLYDRDIHYLKNNEYVEIDNKLVDGGNYFVNKDNTFHTFFKKDKRSNLIVDVEKDNHYLKIYLNKKKSSKLNILNKDNNISFKDILDDIDIDYKVISTKLKESIILKNKNNIPESLTFKIETDLILRINNRKIEAKDLNNNIIFIVDAPYMWDNNKNYNYDITYSLTKEKDNYLLTLNLDKEWLNNAEFPVTIDPTITNLQKDGSDVQDVYISSSLPDSNFDELDSLFLGVADNGIRRVLLKFLLPTIGTASEVVGAKFYLRNRTESTIYESYLAEVHALTKDFNETTATWNNMHDKYESRIEAFDYVTRGYLGTSLVEFDITNLVKRWYAGKPNYGIMLKYNDESTIHTLDWFYSKTYDATEEDREAKRPFLVITYRNLNGIEDYMSYQTLGFTDGYSYINNLTGNLTTTFNLNETIGGKYPISLGVVYNTNDVVLNNNIGYGLGFRLSLHETIEEVTIDNNPYLEYIDADGTLHYFVQDRDDNGNISNNKYLDEDGLGLEASKDNNKYIITDKNGNKYVFALNGTLYYLTELVNTLNDKIVINYDSNKRINRIIDGNNDEINITYNSNNTIITSKHRSTTINYNNNLITSIETKNGITSFTYNNKNLIEKIVDTNGLAKVFNYIDASPYKIKKVTEYGLNNEEGASLTFEYGFLVTRVIDNKGRYNSYSFNERGNTLGITNLKEEADLKNAYGKGVVYEDSKSYKVSDEGSLVEKVNKANNSVSTEILPVKYTKNLIKDSSFENESINIEGQNFNIVEGNPRSGNKSLYICSDENGYGLASITFDVPKGKDYTFSFYSKGTRSYNVFFGYYVEGKIINVEASEEYKRYDITIHYSEDATSPLEVTFTIDSYGRAYIDDIQLEEGKIANYYNLIPSEYLDDLSKWEVSAQDIEANPLDPGVSIVTLQNDIKAMKFNASPEKSITVSTVIPMNGIGNKASDRVGDLYNLSFWYKNTGINIERDMGESTSVLLGFDYTNIPDDMGYGFNPLGIIANNDEWQFFSQPFYADSLYDYDKIRLTFFSDRNCNELYIANITLTKDIKQSYNIHNSDTGNLDSFREVDGRKQVFKYDKNNQLTSMFNPKGNNFKFEYDNQIQDRVLKGISPSGISNEIKYDSFGNPIKTLINNVSYESDGIYDGQKCFIRLKGTNKYLDCDFVTGTINLKEDDCSHDIFTVVADRYYYEAFQISKYRLTNIDNDIVLAQDDDNSWFTTEKNDNGSFSFRTKLGNKSVGVVNDKLCICDTPAEFYFEDTDTPLFIESKAGYTEDGKFITKTIDSLDRTTLYDINQLNGLTNSITDANEQVTTYTYNDKEQITKVEKNNKEVNYTYNNQDLLSSITSGNKEYKFDYDNFLNTKNIKINNQTLVTNEYENNNGNLYKTTYGNGSTILYTYDELDRVKTIINDNNTLNNIYDNIGNLVKVEDDNNIYSYNYDLANKINKYKLENNDNEYIIDYKYDDNDNITSKDYTLNNLNKDTYLIENITYDYNSDDAITKVTFDNNKLNYKYDYLGRLVSKNINDNLKQEYKYISNGNKTSNTINEVKIGNDVYNYKYDNLYNITDIYLNKELINHYEYDNFNELIKEDNYIINKTIEYTYDTEGNILNRKEYELNTNNLIKTDTYEYNNTLWEDRLTKFNNESITYNEIGNPLTIGTKELTWINGRQLDTYKDNELDIKYTYDKNGIRNSKIINGVETKYFTENNKIIFEESNNNMIYYIRDEEGSLIGIKYNDKVYYYIKNLQEDIIGITDSDYNEICIYEYDSFGRIITIKDNNGNIIEDESHIGIINPYRYRSYYYDKETRVYYLNSRYYNPEWGRFINADGIIGANKDILGYNLYAYVSNNPTLASDNEGSFINLKTIVKQARKAVQTLTTIVSATIGAFTGLNSSSDLLIKSINSPGKKMKDNVEKRLTNNVKKSKEMEQALSKCISGNIPKTNFTCSGSIDMNSTKDLHYSIGKASYNIDANYRPLLNTTEISITVSDTYDFPKVSEISSLTDAANYFGRFYQDNNLLGTYQWDITYKEYIFW